MNRRIFTLNVLYIIADVIICLTAISGMFLLAMRFEHWWINLFSLFPLALYFQHVVLLEVKPDGESQEGDDKTE